MKRIIFLFFIILTFKANAQVYDTYGRSQATREWQATERHYESMKSTKKSSSNSNISGNYNAYGWADYSGIRRQEEAGRRIQAREDEYNAKVQKLNQLLKQRNIILSKENYDQIVKAGNDAGFNEYAISRMYSGYDPNAAIRAANINNPNFNFSNPQKSIQLKPTLPKSINELNSSDRQAFEKWVNDAKKEKEIHLQINNLEMALKIFNDPGVQYALAKLYLQKGENVKARTLLYHCDKNEILLNKPSAKELDHLEGYSYLQESMYDFAESYYSSIYKETEQDKEIICETASANFRLGEYENVYNIMKNANENNPENKVIYSLAGAAILAIDSSFKNAEKLFSSVATIEKDKSLEKQIAKKLYEEVQTYRKQTGKVTVVTIFLLDLAVKLDPLNIDYRAERYDSNAFLGRKKETVIDESFLKY